MSSEAQLRKVKVIVACVIGALAVGLLVWQLPKFFAGPVVLDDSNLPPEVIADREDLAMLRALDLPSLQAEIAKREAAMRAAKDPAVQSAAMSAYARATDELATPPTQLIAPAHTQPHEAPMSFSAAADTLAANLEASIDRWVDWLKIPSISTDPAYAGQCRRAAEWCRDQLTELGFSASLVETGTVTEGKGSGHPIVLASIEPASSYKGPHILFYGHYDVQPVDPVSLWHSDPFQPVRRGPLPGEPGGERIVARGAVDDKGQVMTFLEACRAWKQATGHATGGAAYTIVIEGEEESGSVNLQPFVLAHKALLSATDVCLISDTGMLGRNKPAITYGVRGLAYTQVTLHASNQDLHSGLWGGRCPNPITELTRVLSKLHDKNRRVTIPGFYDKVVPISRKERANWAALKFNQKTALKAIGLAPTADIGEKGFTAIEREWGRPTAEINGIWGGYTGEGAKTVIPAQASAKVSFRLVANQNPADITRRFFKWCKDHTPPGCRWELTDHHGGFGVTTPIDSPVMRAASLALKSASGKSPALIKSGGSIPVAGMLKDKLGLDTVFMGFGLDDDRVHSPNEKFELDCFRLGCRAHAAFIHHITSA